MPEFSLTHRTIAPRAGSPPYPGLVLLHGMRHDEMTLLQLAPGLDPRLFAVSVRAPFSYRWGGYTWYDLEGHGPGLGSESIESSIDLLRRFLDEVVEEYGIDPHRLYVGGFSMGAAMAGALALLHPGQVAGAVMVSGYLPPGGEERYRGQEASGHPFFQAHGTYDQVVALEYARLTRDYLQRHTAVDLTYREYPVGHTVTLEELADLATWLEGVLERSGCPTETAR